MDFRHSGEDTSSAGNTSHVHAGNGRSLLLPLPPHTDLFAGACPVCSVGSFTKVSKGGSWPIANGPWDKGDDSVLCGSGSRRWAEFSVTSMLFLFREPEL